jgi:hypothetical protein
MERVSQERRSTKQAEQIESLEKDAAQVRERIEDAAEEWARYVEVNLPLFVRAKLNRNAKAHSGFGRIGQFIGKAGVTKHTNGRSSAVHRNSRLWKEMARIICEVRPRYAFIENSPMLVTNALVWRRGIVLVCLVTPALPINCPILPNPLWALAFLFSLARTKSGKLTST